MMKMKTKIQGETKQGMKRKLEKVEPKAAIKTKVPLKADVILQLKELEERYKELEATNQKHLEKIDFLEERIKNMEKEKQTLTNIQTESGLEMKCSECNFDASSESEFRMHLGKIHGLSHDKSSDDLDSSVGIRDCRRCEYIAEDKYDLDGHIWTEHEEDEDGKVTCKFCDEKFANVANLMRHKKVKHREKIAFCQNYNSGGCPFDEMKCWFLHIRNDETFRCNICNQTFQTKTNFMQHRKLKHNEMVQKCKNKENCVFEKSKLCWFSHESTKEISKDKTENDENIVQ